MTDVAGCRHRDVVEDIHDVLAHALQVAGNEDVDLLAHLKAIREVYGCCDLLGMPDLPDGRRVWAINADAMWQLVTGDHAAALRVRGVLTREMPELADTGQRERDLDDQRAVDSVIAQLKGTPVDKQR